MEISELVKIIPGHLFAVRFKGNKQNEYDRVFDQWDDIEFLDQFFTKNKKDLSIDFYNFCSVEEAVSRTLTDASDFDNRLYQAASGAGNFRFKMGDIFKPLIKKSKKDISWEESKAYGPARKSWLRLYAVRTSLDVYVITGGAIKLTRKMEDRENTRLELQKLSIVAQFLRDKGFETDDDFVYVVFD